MSSEAIDAIASWPMYSSKSSLPKSIANIAAGSMIASLHWRVKIYVRKWTSTYYITFTRFARNSEIKGGKIRTLKFLTSHEHHRPYVELDHSELGKLLPKSEFTLMHFMEKWLMYWCFSRTLKKHNLMYKYNAKATCIKKSVLSFRWRKPTIRSINKLILNNSDK